jgi:hypothetical protein
MVKASRAKPLLGSAITAPLDAMFKMLKAGAEVSAPKRKCNSSDYGTGGGLFHLHDHPKLKISAKSARIVSSSA